MRSQLAGECGLKLTRTDALILFYTPAFYEQDISFNPSTFAPSRSCTDCEIWRPSTSELGSSFRIYFGNFPPERKLIVPHDVKTRHRCDKLFSSLRDGRHSGLRVDRFFRASGIVNDIYIHTAIEMEMA